MAQTKRRRRSKHRGTAAGTIETRGRTGRKPTDREKPDSKATAAERRRTRLDQPPTWQGALTRAGIASGLFFVLAVAALRWPLAPAAFATVFTLAVYIPLGYYTDLFIYRRRQKRKTSTGKAKR